MYHLYILQCADGTLYAGITVDLKRRTTEHNSSALGAKYTRGRRPVQLVYSKKFRTRSTASRAESRIKRLSRSQKLDLISSPPAR
ncbi:MAG: GIY-YIG nuclease family protein [Candidatus Moraniibacteriota bacterium]